MPQNTRNAEQQFRVYMAVVEYLIRIGAVAMDGLGEPGDGPSLSLKLGLNQMSKMKVLHRDSISC